MSFFTHTNQLIHETSPYLLQHAHNPVDWHAWNETTLLKARKENKLLLISIGYATCHWCHVMEHESFEDQEVAKIMNRHFVCIKVDREERPDVDQIYMDAVQLLTGRGGWPLNTVALPDGKPFWGGTYFPKQNWTNILTEIARLWEQETDKIYEYAENLTKGIRQKDLFPFQNEQKPIEVNQIKSWVNNWKRNFDHQWGGMNRAPKFPLPNNYHFLLRFAFQSQDNELLNFVNLTLQKMAFGGLFDPLRGGFARYSTDSKWHVPHFEKMLYDNGQLISLYADAYLITQNPLYKQVIEKTLLFVETELYDAEMGGFYSALDADSENEQGKIEEGAYYIWTEKELKNILREDFELFSRYYNINAMGHWEHGKYVLLRTQTDEDFTLQYHLSPEDLNIFKNRTGQKLLQHQSKRPRPLLDDKILTSWNALMCKGFTDAYRVLGNPKYLEIAQKNAQFILTKMLRKDTGLYRNFKDGKTSINAFLEDYATVIDSLLTLYEVTFKESYLTHAQNLTEYIFKHFQDTESGFFYFTSDEDTALVSRKTDVPDDVIPSGNSIMARNLFKLGHLFNDENYKLSSQKMLNNVLDHVASYPSGFSNWMFLALDRAFEYYEIAVTGNEALQKLGEVQNHYIPNKLIAGSTVKSSLPLLHNRFDSEKTVIFVCQNQTCNLPTYSVNETLKQIKTFF